MTKAWALFLFILVLFFKGANAFGADSLSSDELFLKYQTLQKQTLERLVNLENRIDGLTDEFRSLLGDRKKNYTTDFKGPGKTLFDPNLLYAMITERKRLEKEMKFQEEIAQSAGLKKQYAKKIAGDLIALETSAILITYTEYLDRYFRGEKQLGGAPIQDLEVLKTLAATHTAIDYSAKNKNTKSFSDPRVLAFLKPEDRQSFTSLLESGLGKANEDPIPYVPPKNPSEKRDPFEKERLKKTKQLIAMLDQITATLLLANKPLLDEYQYRLLVLKEKLKPTENRGFSHK